MNFEQLLISALSRADEEPGDEIIDRVAEDSVNEGYRKVATTVDTQIKRKVIQYDDVDGVELPEDCFNVASLEHNNVRLSENDYYTEGNVLYITNRDYKNKEYDFNLRYIYYPEKMVNKNDKPITSEHFDVLITLYGAYNIMIYKKRYQMAELIKREFDELSGGGASEL